MKQRITNTVAGLLALGSFVLGGTAFGAGVALMEHSGQATTSLGRTRGRLMS